MATEKEQLQNFFERRVKELSDELAAYEGMLKLVDSLQDDTPSQTYRMLLDMAKKDNRFSGR